MGVAVLQPQDCLRTVRSRKHLSSSHPPTMKLPNPNPKPSRSTGAHPNRQKRIQNAPHQTRPGYTSEVKPQVNKLVMGQVKILKRGEPLTETTPDPKTKTAYVAAFRSTEPLTEIAGGLYAGSCVASPPPSSVPLPVFVTKKIAAVSEATNDLRKMLRLEFS